MELDLLPENEPTVVEYARLHSLCTDFTQENPPLHELQPISDDAFDSDLQDPPGVPLLTNPADELIKERLFVDRKAALLLRSVHTLFVPLDESPPTPDGRRRLRSSKQEVPLLRTDHELDMLHFGSTATPNFEDLKIPLELVNVEKDEGLEWPSTYSAYPAQCYEQAKSEKLAMSRETFLYIQDAIKDQFAPRDAEEIKAEGLEYEKNTATQPLTPPLLPLAPPLTPYVPSSPTNHIQILSEDSNSTTAEAKALEDTIMGADALFRHDAVGDDLMLMEMTDIEQLSPVLDLHASRSKRKAEYLRVEGPLTPPMFSESPTKKLKSVKFSAMVRFIPEIPSTYENGNNILTSDGFAGFYHEVESLAEGAKGKIENEKLSEADTTKRVDVPSLEFVLPVAPWNEYKQQAGGHHTDDTELNAQMKFLLHVKRTHTKSAESWHGISKLERELHWTPIAGHSTKVTIGEKLHGEESLSKMLDETRLGNIITSSSTLWHRCGLRILDDDLDLEELDLADMERPEETRDLNAVARKRKLELEREATDAEHQRKSANSLPPRRDEHPKSVREVNESPHWNGRVPEQQAPTKPQPTILLSHRSKRQETDSRSKTSQQPEDSDRSLMFGGKFSATNALENFMAIQGLSVGPPKMNKHKTSISVRPPASPMALPVRSREQTLDSTSGTPHARVQPTHTTRPPLRLLSVPRDLPSCSFIIASTLLQQRHLSKHIEKQYPNAEFVSRDFALPHSSGKEADLLLSPSTGLIISTLQQVKQRALPGQPDRSPIKERISSLQYRYERLLIMITEGLNRDMEEQGSSRPIDARDQEAIEAFEKFASQIEGEVLVRYVPGGEQALARSIIGEMATYGLPHGSKDIGDIKPLPDETNWELFLRRAGLNPFAAQVILAWLKDTIDYPLTLSSPTNSSLYQSQTVSTFGLQTFLMMSTERRMESLQAMLGGSRVLKRVCAVLDQEWVCAAHGFRMG